jgi:uncharacterized protein (TIGR03790 family)
MLAGCVSELPPEPVEPMEPDGVVLPRHSIGAAELGLIVNLDDPLSIQVADAYQSARQIPEANRLELHLGSDAQISAADFAVHKQVIDDSFGEEIQAIALTSMLPHKVSCMGMTAAVALGFDERYCASMPPCSGTAPVDYYTADTTRPFTEHQLRPTMILAATSLEDAQALIARGQAADSTFPAGTGWFVNTSDSVRSVRWERFLETIDAFDGWLDLRALDNSDAAGSDFIEEQQDVLFYFTGLREVEGIASNSYRPGAIADHLTSFGGELPSSSQMSALAWLQAGATGSFGTAHEPCAFPAKFPDTLELLRHYTSGNTLVEAYWKSVWSPGEGNFVGEPLARPFGGAMTSWDGTDWTVTTAAMRSGSSYSLQQGESEDGPWTDLRELEVLDEPGLQTLVIRAPTARWYRILEL